MCLLNIWTLLTPIQAPPLKLCVSHLRYNCIQRITTFLDHMYKMNVNSSHIFSVNVINVVSDLCYIQCIYLHNNWNFCKTRSITCIAFHMTMHLNVLKEIDN